MKPVKYIFLSLIIITQLTVNAQYNWEEIVLPDSVDVKMIAFDTDGVHYIASNKGVFASETCYQWEQTSLTDYVSYIHINNNNTIYAGMNTLFRSFDFGATWDSIFFSSQGGMMSLQTIGDSILFLGTWGGIFRSIDSGVTWTHVFITFNSEVFNDIVINSDGILFAGSTSFSGADKPGGVYRSDDNGANWNLIGLDYHFVSSMVINADDEIYVGTRGHWVNGGGRVFKSSNHGDSWEILYENNLIATMAINYDDEISIGCATQGYPGGIYCSYKDDYNWEEITNNLPSNSFDQVVFGQDNHLYTITHSEDRVFRTETPVNVSKRQFAQQDSFIIYPNPATNELFIKTEDIESFKELNIYDCLGNKVLHKEIQSNKIDISTVKEGMYVVEFVTSETKLRQKLLVN